jgi:hypothetical protein
MIDELAKDPVIAAALVRAGTMKSRTVVEINANGEFISVWVEREPAGFFQRVFPNPDAYTSLPQRPR